jgi:hypothetical protein
MLHVNIGFAGLDVRRQSQVSVSAAKSFEETAKAGFWKIAPGLGQQRGTIGFSLESHPIGRRVVPPLW